MDIDAKLRPLYILKILKEKTDEDNFLTTTQLCAILKNNYCMDTHRTIIKGDIEVLQQAGFGIEEQYGGCRPRKDGNRTELNKERAGRDCAIKIKFRKFMIGSISYGKEKK